MPMYNFSEYSDNYSDTSGSLWQFKSNEPLANNVDFNANSDVFNSESFKYKAALLEKISNYVYPNIFAKDKKMVVPLKYAILRDHYKGH